MTFFLLLKNKIKKLKITSFLKISFSHSVLCLQHFHDFLVLSKKCTLDPATNKLSTRGATTGPADVFFHFRQFHKNGRSHGTNSSNWPGHTPHADFGAFPTLLVQSEIILPPVQDSLVLLEAVSQDSLQ